jgi:TPR repeat protein
MPKNIEGVFQWFKKAALVGLGSAMLAVSEMLDVGDGVEKDRVKARAWLRKAGAVGVAEARARLAQG